MSEPPIDPPDSKHCCACDGCPVDDCDLDEPRLCESCRSAKHAEAYEGEYDE